MRYELQVILWVSAGLLTVGSFFFGADQQLDLASGQVATLPAAIPEKLTSDNVGLDAQIENGPLEDFRPIFRWAASATLPVLMQQASETETGLALRGLITSSDASKALVANGEQTYALLAVGEEAFGHVLVEIGVDHVIVRDRETSVLKKVILRGTKESPE